MAKGVVPVKPTRMLFYRDGISEGEFAQVREQEVAKIKGGRFGLISPLRLILNRPGIAFAETCVKMQIPNIKLTFVVVGKVSSLYFCYLVYRN